MKLMSNSLAIEAVTSALQRLIEDGARLLDNGDQDPEFTDLEVTTQPPDRARNNRTNNQINLFLYQTAVNAALRNMDMPRHVRSGESSLPPLALNLYYLVTAYGRNNEDTMSHRLLGRAMRILHDYSVLIASDLLSPTEISDLFRASGLDLQPERVRLTPVPMSVDEMSKLWMIFQTQYRISAAYQAAVLLIESTRQVRSSLPVLRRGSEDRGAEVISSASPLIDELLLPNSQPGARLGEDLIIKGKHLESQGVVVRFSSLRLDDYIEIEPLPGGNANQIEVHLEDQNEDPGAMARWVSGFYTVSLVARRPDMPSWTSNEVPFALAPRITIEPDSAQEGDLTLTVTCTPRIREGQRIVLLFGESQANVQTITNPADESLPTTLDFFIPDVEEGSYLVRLRIDGADSIPVILTGTPPRLEFDPNQKVSIE
jgi:hypothetical protein